jgi:hypothetical protein
MYPLTSVSNIDIDLPVCDSNRAKDDYQKPLSGFALRQCRGEIDGS